MKAYLKNVRQSPRKVRKVADLVRGKEVNRALTILDHTGKRATHHIQKLLRSALANAKSTGSAPEKDLFVKTIRVDEGVTLKRSLPRAQGRVTLIRKRTSNVALELGEKAKNETT